MNVISTEVRPHSGAAEARLQRAIEWPMALLALAVIPALVVEHRAATESARNGALMLNWLIWLAFVGELLAKLAVASNRVQCLRRSWFELTVIIITPPFVPEVFQGARTLRVLRLFRLMRAGVVAGVALRRLRTLLQHKGFAYVLCVGTVAVSLGAVGIYVLERGITVESIGDAYWWAIVTVTTVGYGDVSPKTTEGRVIAAVLMIVGIGVISVFTATLASFFLSNDQPSDREARTAPGEHRSQTRRGAKRPPMRANLLVFALRPGSR